MMLCGFVVQLSLPTRAERCAVASSSAVGFNDDRCADMIRQFAEFKAEAQIH
jgi:hypothetical protein